MLFCLVVNTIGLRAWVLRSQKTLEHPRLASSWLGTLTFPHLQRCLAAVRTALKNLLQALRCLGHAPLRPCGDCDAAFESGGLADQRAHRCSRRAVFFLCIVHVSARVSCLHLSLFPPRSPVSTFRSLQPFRVKVDLPHWFPFPFPFPFSAKFSHCGGI